MSDARYSIAAMTAFTHDALVANGVPEADAGVAARQMIEADITGFDAHGIFRLGMYCNTLKSGRCNPRPNIRTLQRSAATALVDGDDGIGHLVMTYATNLAMELARESGIGWVGARNSNHAGAAGIYAEMPTRENMVGIYAAVSTANHMAVWGARRGAARHQPDRDRHSGRQGSAGGARHRHVGVVLRHHPAACGAGQADAGRLGRAQQDRQADQRPEAGRRGRAAADRRLQGQRPRSDHRAAGRRAERRRVRA